MKKQLLRFALYPIITYFICGTLNPAVAASQPSVGRGTHFCGVIDYPSNRQHSDQYPNRRYARTAAANLDVGEPRTIRMIYFLPNDRPYRADVVQKMKDEIRTVQNFFADQMGAHGYGNKTFRLETDSQGALLVHRVDGQYPDSHYLYRTEDTVFAEIERKFDVMQNIYSIVIDNSINEIRWGEGRQASGFGGRLGKNGGLVLHSGEFGWQTLAHHMGHAFGLWHDFSDGAYIMSYGPGRNRLSPYYTEYLSVHPYFNPEIPLEAGQTSTMEFISPRTYPAGSENVSIRLKVSDSEGLYQVLLLLRTRPGRPGAGSIEVKAGRGFMGEKDAIVEFDYDGVTPSDKFTSLSNPAAHRIHVQTVDTAGNVSQEYFVLAKISPYHIASLEGHTGAVHSMSFSSDGKTLASGAYDNMVKLWNVELGTNIAIFPGGRSMSFSSDGTTLASAWKDTVKLWDVTTQQVIATLSHTSFVHSVSFSSNGGILASGLEDGTIKLWNIETKESITTLEGHTDRVHSVSFSADGTLLVSGSDDNRIKLWDIKTKENITTLEGHTAGFRSVVFSPDGRTLASGSSDKTVKLWDVATESNFAALEGHLGWISSVSFSSDGVILASAGGWDNTINLWEVTTGANFATLGSTSGFHSVSFSDDGRILAAGTKEGTVELWDTSGWLEARLEVVVEIDIPDSDLRAAIATALGAPVGVSIVRGHLENLTRLEASNANISDLTGLEFATNLTTLELGPERVANEWRNSNAVKDLSPLAGLTRLTWLHLPINSISDISAVANLSDLTWLNLSHNHISDLSPLVANTGLGKGDKVYVRGNPLSYLSIHTHIPTLKRRGVTVEFDNRTLTSPLKISGDDQQGTPGTALERPFVVEVRDAGGSAFEGVPVTFTVTAGGGALSATRVTTDRNGRAESTLTLGPIPGTNTVTVSVAGIQEGQTFNAEGIGVPKTLEIVSGDDQEGLPGAALDNPFVVEVRNQSDKPLPDAQVTFSVTGGGGTLSATSVTTDSNGRAESTLTLGPNPGTNTVTVSVTGIQAEQTFTAEGIRIPKTLEIISGKDQEGSPATALENLFVVEVRDQTHKPLPDAQVTFSVTGGGGTLSATSVTTDSNGRAESTLTLGPNPGTNTVTVSVTGIQAEQMFTAEGIRIPLAFWIISGDKQQGLPGEALAKPFVVEVRDRSGEPLPGVLVTFSVTSGGGTLSVTSATTESGGRAKSILTLGPNPGTNTVEVGVTGIQEKQTVSAIAELPAIPQDVNRDDVVNILDLVLVASDLGDEGADLMADVNGDGVVNILDLVLVAGAFGDVAAPASDTQALAMLTAADVGQWWAQAQTLDLPDTASREGVLVLEQLLAVLAPKETILLPNYPNPFNPETWIPYQLAENASVTLTIHDTTGVVVRRLDLGHRFAGYYTDRGKAAHWDGRNESGEPVASGVYFYQLATPSFRQIRRMVILK